MAEFLGTLGVPPEAIVTEGGSRNTHEHAQNLPTIFQEHKLKRILLVTSAMHIPRALGAFRKQFPAVEFMPASTDYHATEQPSNTPWYRELSALIPTPDHLQAFTEVMHEYHGIAYDKMRGWM